MTTKANLVLVENIGPSLEVAEGGEVKVKLHPDNQALDLEGGLHVKSEFLTRTKAAGAKLDISEASNVFEQDPSVPVAFSVKSLFKRGKLLAPFPGVLLVMAKTAPQGDYGYGGEGQTLTNPAEPNENDVRLYLSGHGATSVVVPQAGEVSFHISSVSQSVSEVALLMYEGAIEEVRYEPV